MKIVFQNECNERILVCVENCTVLEIHPKQQCAKEIEDTDVLAIGVHFRRESSVKKREYGCDGVSILARALRDRPLLQGRGGDSRGKNSRLGSR